MTDSNDRLAANNEPAGTTPLTLPPSRVPFRSWFQRLSLAHKQATLITIAGSVAVILLVVTQTFISLQTHRMMFRDAASARLDSAGPSALVAAVEHNALIARNSLRIITADPLVEAAELVLTDGTVLAARKSPGTLPPSQVANALFSNVHAISRELKISDKSFGVLVAHLDANALVALFVHNTLHDVEWVCLCAVLMLLLVAACLQRFMIRPFAEISGQAAQLDSEVPLRGRPFNVGRVHVTDELGVLSRAVNRTLGKLATTQEALRHLTQNDPMTGLPNRTYLNTRLTEILALAEVEQAGVAVLFVDLDGFKVINDLHGHEVGDGIVTIIAERIKKSCRDVDTVARFGGDEFVLCVHIPDRADMPSTVDTIAHRLLRAASSPVIVNDKTSHLTASVGVAVYPDHASDSATLIKFADNAMYEAKSQGGGCYRVFSNQYHHSMARRASIENDIRTALHNNEFELHAQPIVTSDESHRSDGYECLLRWVHNGVNIRPDEFIPVAEKTRDIVPIGRWVLKEAIRIRQTLLPRDSTRSLRISVNVSPVQLQWDDGFVEFAKELLIKSGLPRGCVVLEVTEGVMTNEPERAAEQLSQLADVGYFLAIDDFGTGYSNLSQLERLPFHLIKIDKRFIAELPEVHRAAIGIIHLAEALGVAIVAEGVETQAQVDWLRAHGVPYLQGYFFSRPVPVSEIRAQLQSSEAVVVDVRSAV